MTANLVAKGLSGGHGHRTLFDSLDLSVAPGDVVGVVGANGAGKTTLLRLLAGDAEPLSGSVSTAPSDAFVGWLPQEHERLPGESISGYLARRTGAAETAEVMQTTAEALGTGSDGADDATPWPWIVGWPVAPRTWMSASRRCWPSWVWTQTQAP